MALEASTLLQSGLPMTVKSVQMAVKRDQDDHDGRQGSEYDGPLYQIVIHAPLHVRQVQPRK